jgi:hypothetical protein
MVNVPNRPQFQPQNPAKSGCKLGWLSCTCFACAMLLDIAFFGTKIPKGCTIRTKTGDTSGGTTLPQVDSVATNSYGVNLETHTGGNVASYEYAAKQLKAGRAFILQIGTHPLLSTKFRSTAGSINHAITIGEGRGWKKNAAGWYEPKEVLWYDPAADGRHSYVDQGPSWIPWWLVRQAAAALHPWGEDDSRTLGGNRMYAAFMPPPKVRFRYGGTLATPTPDRVRVKSPVAGRSAVVRSRPTSLAKEYVVGPIANGTLWWAYQKTRGVQPSGSTSSLWYGDWTGTRWIHSSNIEFEGGDS